jgi:uncharacterized protein
MAGILLDSANVTEQERAAHARALSAKNRQAALQWAAEAKTRVGEKKMRKALAINGTVISDEIIEPGPWSRRLAAGEHLRIIDLEGRQAVDFLCYDAKDYENRYNAANTIKLNRSIYIAKGMTLYSDRVDVLMTMTEDEVGFHDTIAGCCSAESNHLRYGIVGTPSCRANFIEELAKHGLQPRDLPANINFFMYVPVRPDGTTEILEGKSEPGDFVDLRAERDVLAVISNCPQIYNPCSGWNPTPVRVIVWKPKLD